MEDPQKRLLDDIIDDEWNSIIDSSIDISGIPVHFVKELTIITTDGEEVIFPIRQWINDKTSLKKIEKRVSDWYNKYKDITDRTKYVIDVELLRTRVEEETNRLLKDI